MQEDSEKQDYEFMKTRVQEELKHTFKPEFLNRIDETIVFRALNKNDMTKIVSIMTKSLEKRCKDQMDLVLNLPDKSSSAKASSISVWIFLRSGRAPNFGSYDFSTIYLLTAGRIFKTKSICS